MQIPEFLVSSAMLLAISASQHNHADRAAIGIAACAMAYLMPSFLEEYRGAFYRQPRMIVLIMTIIAIITEIVRFILDSHRSVALGMVVSDLGFGAGVLVISVALNQLPPRDKSKKSKTSEALRRIIEKITSIYGTPKPIPVRS